MLYCASYHEPDNHHGELISISRSVPKGIEVARHLDFFKPTQDLLNWWKSTPQNESAWTEYTSRFWSILSDRKTQILDWIHALERKPTQDMTSAVLGEGWLFVSSQPGGATALEALP